MKYNRKKVVELLRTGNFTIAYHDNQSPSLYKGKLDYDQLENKKEIDLEGVGDGYCPQIVCLLVEALDGYYDSI